MIIKLLSYNIHKGFDWINQKYFLKEIKDFIRSLDVEIVFMQEVIGKNTILKRKGFIDGQFEFLADQIWPHFSYAQNAIYDHGHHGNLILSKYPIIEYENLNISTNPFEKRGFLFCKIEIPKNGRDKSFFYAGCSHLSLLSASRETQYQKIRKHIDDIGKRENDLDFKMLLAGDFNDWNKKSSRIFETDLRMLEMFKAKNGQYAKTYPAVWPMLCLDRVYARQAKVRRVQVLSPKNSSQFFTHLSDHLPLFCELEFL